MQPQSPKAARNTPSEFKALAWSPQDSIDQRVNILYDWSIQNARNRIDWYVGAA